MRKTLGISRTYNVVSQKLSIATRGGMRHLVLICLLAGVAHADDVLDVRAELTEKGDPLRLVVTDRGAKLEGLEVAKGTLVGTLKTGHGTTIAALSVDDAKTPFRIYTFDGKKLSKPQLIARPKKLSNFPFAVVATRTPDGFTVFFQEVETANQNEAHTFMVELDKAGVAGEAKEVQIPWSLADAIWNGKGYHLALFYAVGVGSRLSMVSTTSAGVPEQHPDWASEPGAISDVHLVETDGKIRAIYRNLDRMLATDVTTIGQWGQVRTKAKDLGALGNAYISIDAKGRPIKVKSK